MGDLSRLKAGDRVRVSFEGEVKTFVHTGDPTTCTGMWVKSDWGSEYHVPREGATFELVEPEYVHCGVYQDADENVYQFDAEHETGQPIWWVMGGGYTIPFGQPVRPLVRLVPEHD